MDAPYVLVTTTYRGVFYGQLVEEKGADSIVLKDCRNVMSWEGKRGFLGLASHGPEEGSVLGSTASKVWLYSITAVAKCTPEAEEAAREWEGA